MNKPCYHVSLEVLLTDGIDTGAGISNTGFGASKMLGLGRFEDTPLPLFMIHRLVHMKNISKVEYINMWFFLSPLLHNCYALCMEEG
ncbi:hypothetical protein ACJX0J_030900, partial [Zea mays]